MTEPDDTPHLFDPREMPHFTDLLIARVHLAAKSGKKPDDLIQVRLGDIFGVVNEVSEAHQRLAGMLGLEVTEDA